MIAHTRKTTFQREKGSHEAIYRWRKDPQQSLTFETWNLEDVKVNCRSWKTCIANFGCKKAERDYVVRATTNQVRERTETERKPAINPTIKGAWETKKRAVHCECEYLEDTRPRRSDAAEIAVEINENRARDWKDRKGASTYLAYPWKELTDKRRKRNVAVFEESTPEHRQSNQPAWTRARAATEIGCSVRDDGVVAGI